MRGRQSTRYPGVYWRSLADGSRSYQISYTDSLGRRVFEKVQGGERDAVRARAAILERIHKGERVAPSKWTVRELADAYLRAAEPHLEASTYRTYEHSIDKHVVPKLGHLRVSDVGRRQVAAFVGELKKTGYTAWYIHGILTPLSQMFEHAREEGWAAANPVRQLSKRERPSGFSRKMRILDEDEIGLVLGAATATFKTLWATLIFAGLRIGEALALQWSDVDFEAGLIRVQSGKTEAAAREVTVPDLLVQLLAAESGTDGPVFLTRDGEPMKRRTVDRAFKATLVRAGVPHARLHDCRHTFASILIGQGEDVTYVADQMGHADPAITLRTYAKLFDPKARREQARQRMQERFEAIV